MVVVEVLAGVLVAGLLVATTVMAYVGMLGILGGVRFVRCDHCRHLGLTSPLDPLRSCTYCRHGLLLHPLTSLNHAHAAISGEHRTRSGS